MPRRPSFSSHQLPGEMKSVLEHLRTGTREQFESGWISIPPGITREFIHSLGEVPWVVHVLRSETGDGTYPTEPPAADITVVRLDASSTRGSGDRALTVKNNAASTYYFKVRAM